MLSALLSLNAAFDTTWDTTGPQLICVFSVAVAQLSVSIVIILNVTLLPGKETPSVTPADVTAAVPVATVAIGSLDTAGVHLAYRCVSVS